MKPNTLIRVLRGRGLAGAQGFYQMPHPNLPGYGYCFVSLKAPHPTPDTKRPDLPKPMILSLDQLQPVAL